MAKENKFSDVKVAVVLIVNDGKILAVFNDNWGAYTLPMSKRREWKKPGKKTGVVVEDWLDAAIRARAEWVPGTRCDTPGLELEIPEFQQSDRDGQWKRYGFHVFKMALDNVDAIRSGAIAEWLTPDEFLDEDRRPISKTARDIIRQALAEAQLAGQPFP